MSNDLILSIKNRLAEICGRVEIELIGIASMIELFCCEDFHVTCTR